MMSKRRKQQQRQQIVAVVFGLVALIVVGGWLNWTAYSAHICREVPNHYSCK